MIFKIAPRPEVYIGLWLFYTTSNPPDFLHTPTQKLPHGTWLNLHMQTTLWFQQYISLHLAFKAPLRLEGIGIAHPL